MTFPGADTMKGGASGDDIFLLCDGRELPFVEALTGESCSSEDEWAPLLVAPFRMSSVTVCPLDLLIPLL